MSWRGVLLVTLLLAVGTAQAGAPALFPIHQNGHLGFIDRSGRVVIEPRYDETLPPDVHCPPFNDGLQPVRLDQAWGYIDTRGNLVVPPRFAVAGCFHEGLAAARSIDEVGKAPTRLYGYIDRRGAWAIPPRFDDAQPFSEGLAVVQIDHRLGYIDKRGRAVIPPTPRVSAADGSFVDAHVSLLEGGTFLTADRAAMLERALAQLDAPVSAAARSRGAPPDIPAATRRRSVSAQAVPYSPAPSRARTAPSTSW